MCREVVQEPLSPGGGHRHFPIQSWADFEQQFRSQFFLVNAEADAVNALEGSVYYQGNQTVDDYLDSFLTLASDAGYTDPWTLVVKFRRGLWTNIQSQIATMPFGRPTDTDPEAWYAAALEDRPSAAYQ